MQIKDKTVWFPMSNAQDKVPKENSESEAPKGSAGTMGEKEEKREELPEIPEEWKDINFQDLYDKDYKPYKRIDARAGITYLSLRKGENKEKRLGRYTEAKWQLLQSMFPKKLPPPPPNVPKEESPSFLDPRPDEFDNNGADQSSSVPPESQMPQRQYFKTPIQRVAIIPKSFIPRLLTLQWFEELKKHGYPGDMNEFVNDIVETHFSKCHGLFVQVIEKVQG